METEKRYVLKNCVTGLFWNESDNSWVELGEATAYDEAYEAHEEASRILQVFGSSLFDLHIIGAVIPVQDRMPLSYAVGTVVRFKDEPEIGATPCVITLAYVSEGGLTYGVDAVEGIRHEDIEFVALPTEHSIALAMEWILESPVQKEESPS